MARGLGTSPEILGWKKGARTHVLARTPRELNYVQVSHQHNTALLKVFPIQD